MFERITVEATRIEHHHALAHLHAAGLPPTSPGLRRRVAAALRAVRPVRVARPAVPSAAATHRSAPAA